MSLQWSLSRDIPADTAALGQQLFAPAHVYRLIGDHFDQLFPDEQVFAPLYDRQGRGAISPLLLALVTVFQLLEQVPDRQAAEFVAARLDWKYALHLPLSYPGVHFTDLSAFRARLLAGQQERLVFDQLLTRLQALGLVRPTGKLRSDSTHILGVVERLSQLELLSESLRLALRAVTQAAGAWVQAHLPPAFLEGYAQRQSEYGLSDAQVREKTVQVGRDAEWFLAHLDRLGPEAVQHLAEVETLRAVLAQPRPMGTAVIESPHEPEVRRGQKRGRTWIGYKAQISESCDPDQPRLIVDLEPSGALEADQSALLPLQARLQRQGLVPSQQYVDQGYMSAANLAASQARGIQLMGVPLGDTQGPVGFQQGDFQIDEAAQQARCPAGALSRVWAPDRAGPILIRFAGQICQACPSFGVCTSSPQGRSLTLHPQRALLGQQRAAARTAAFQEQLRLRAGIEATISELVRK